MANVRFVPLADGALGLYTPDMSNPPRLPEVVALKQEADKAFQRADHGGAARIFQSALDLAPGDVDLLMGLAASLRAGGQEEAALAAVDQALVVEPRLFAGLLLKGAILDGLGREKAAATAFLNALRLAPPNGDFPEPMKRAIARARVVCQKHQAELIERMRSAAELGALSPRLSRRMESFIEIAAGRRRFYAQRPIQTYYPGLPAIEFYERDLFSWLPALEADWAAIRDEAISVWSEDTPGLTPYVNLAPGEPVDQWSQLNHSLQWSAFHLHQGGEPVPANMARCPATAAALRSIDQPEIPGRSPNALFSILRPGARIPPHHGLNNTHLVLHLGLITPEGCALRVGGETRTWREGEAFVFDDTIEHEAWNTSPSPRAVLICVVWNPILSDEERRLITRLTGVVDEFNAFAPRETVD